MYRHVITFVQLLSTSRSPEPVNESETPRRDSLINSRNGWRESWTFNEDGLPRSHRWRDILNLNTPNVIVDDTFLLRDDAGRVRLRTGLDGANLRYA